ncbi:unknown [Firmicutes bacterium CAG:449]|nr:unknown [Firmicutes bacterium CAG:449]
MLLVIFGKSLLASAEPLIFLAKTERIFSSLPLIDLSLLFKKITFSVDALI